MADDFAAKFYFETEALGSDTFRVLDFEGHEEISRPFRFEINLVSDDPEVDLDAVINEPAEFSIERDGERRTIHGVLAEFEQRDSGPKSFAYRAVLVPRLWLLSLNKHNQVHASDPGGLTGWSSGLTVGDIIESELKDGGFSTDDYELNLEEHHAYHEYIVQRNETDLAFISRLMEHEGIFYYFTHDDDKDKLIIADKNARFEPIDGETEMIYRPGTGMVNTDREAVHKLGCRRRRAPKEFMLRDYNWRTPSLDLTVTAEVEGNTVGHCCEYGDHYKETDKEGATLVRMRSEELVCRQTMFSGQGNGIAFRAGQLFHLAEHFRPDYDCEYLILSVHHRGSQSTAGASATGAGESKPSYVNEFSCILSEVPFRPARITPKPRIMGSVNAKIDSSGTGEFAELDEQGRYRVTLSYDQRTSFTDLGGGASSRWIRMAQPYGGPEYGMHFPLLKGTEVIVTHIDGDPDRPIIVGTVPNDETRAPVDGEDSRKNVLRTSSGNMFELDDTPGQEGFYMSNRKMGAVKQMRARPRKLD